MSKLRKEDRRGEHGRREKKKSTLLSCELQKDRGTGETDGRRKTLRVRDSTPSFQREFSSSTESLVGTTKDLGENRSVYIVEDIEEVGL